MKDSIRRTALISLPGCVSLMPLLILPVMVGGFVGPAAATTLVSPGAYAAMLTVAAVCFLLVAFLTRFVTSRLPG